MESEVIEEGHDLRPFQKHLVRRNFEVHEIFIHVYINIKLLITKRVLNFHKLIYLLITLISSHLYNEHMYPRSLQNLLWKPLNLKKKEVRSSSEKLKKLMTEEILTFVKSL